MVAIKKEDIIDKMKLSPQRVTVDNPQVEIARMAHESVKELSNDKNDVFSQLTKDSLQDETLDYALAIVFARQPMRGLEDRLKIRNITIPGD